ncbi:MAG: hypothetical protein FWH22_10640, partial [Fibromonadales bacterium]|nr:hypothetical protein [Fibromonadales bacterium]
MKLTTKHKHGVSLIAVLMFMLAATTASVVVFQWVSQENVASGTRLKMSEAHQASQAGLEAVQGWLTNKGADVGALMRTFEHNNKKSVELSSNLLGSIKSNRQQNFKVYLTDIDTRVQPYKLKFLSVGTSRNDESKHSQAGIFEVAGLYKMSVSGWYHNGIVPSAPQLPEFYGKVGSGTQGLLSSGYITGDLNTTQGFSSTGDLLITGIADMASGAIIGCPLKPGSSNEQVNPSNDSRPSPYNPELYGNYYVKENHTSHGIGFCGKVYAGANFNVKGQTVIWGDLYVKGDLNITNSLRIHGNLTVEGDIIFSGSSFSVGGNLVMLNSDSKFKIEADQNVRIYGSSWIAGDLTRSVNNNNKLEFCSNTDNDGLAKNGDLLYIGPTDYNDYTNNCSTPNSPTGIPPFGGAEPLDYLGDQITKEKKNGKYTIPDPIVLGIANNEWKTRNIHETSCTALRSFANADGVIEIDSETNASLLMDAINACPSNWTGADKTPWLVLRMYWGGINLFQDQVFRKDVIIVVENKPTAMDLPMTLSNTNVLLWLTKGSGTIFIRNTSIGNRARNYFIYSEDDINTIDGSQYLRGNIFMANGKSVGAMQDPTMQANPELYAALAAAGII